MCSNVNERMDLLHLASKVICSDLRPKPLERARRNAQLFGVAEQLEFRLGSGLEHLEPEEADIYLNYAKQMMKSLYDSYAVKDPAKSNGLVLHSTYSNHSPYNTCNHYGVDECNSWGDYFYMEALTRLRKDWELYW